MEESKSFAVGHLALGYISSKTSTKILKTSIDLPIIFMLSVIPDVDLLIPFIEHRGPTHSIITTVIVFIPFFAIYHKKATPYFIALIQHSLIGDYISGGKIQLLWPITTQYYGTGISIKSNTNIIVEWILFFASAIILLMTKDSTTFFQPRKSNLILTIPTFTVLLPTFLSYPLGVPAGLMLPHVFYTFIFLVSIIIDLSGPLKKMSVCK